MICFALFLNKMSIIWRKMFFLMDYQILDCAIVVHLKVVQLLDVFNELVFLGDSVWECPYVVISCMRPCKIAFQWCKSFIMGFFFMAKKGFVLINRVKWAILGGSETALSKFWQWFLPQIHWCNYNVWVLWNAAAFSFCMMLTKKLKYF